jgi:transcriptional regulator with XRE-family HTH domain
MSAKPLPVADPRSSLRRRLRQVILDALEKDGVTRAELARRLGVSPSRVTHMLEPDAFIGVEMLAWIAHVLGRRWVIALEPEEE